MTKQQKKEYNKHYYSNNKEKIKEYNKHYYLDNKEKVSEYDKKRYHDPSTGVKQRKMEASRKRYATPSIKLRTMCLDFQRNYGITLEERDKMIQDQDNKCLRCGLPFEGNGRDSLAPGIDHDHSFERGDPDSIRGILHSRCNTMLGLHNDSIEDLQLSIDYLKNYGVKK